MLRRLVAAAVVLAGTACAVLIACSGPGSSGPPPKVGCDTTFDTFCDEATPSWSTQVQPIVQQYCTECHTDGGPGESLFNATSYKTIHSGAAAMVQAVNNCSMPNLDASPPAPLPSDEQRQTLITWIACGSPEN